MNSNRVLRGGSWNNNNPNNLRAANRNRNNPDNRNNNNGFRVARSQDSKEPRRSREVHGPPGRAMFESKPASRAGETRTNKKSRGASGRATEGRPPAPIMKRHDNLFSSIYTFENLLLAARKASRGKRFRDNILSFNDILEKELLLLQKQLREYTYKPGSYKAFHIFEPKKRLISAAPFRDRVVHHALCNVIEPIFERAFIFDTYANRKGKGTHKAVDRYTEFSRKNPYVLKCDIKKFFPSMDHEVLLGIIRRKIKCPETIWLIKTILDGSNPQEPVLDYFHGDDLFTPVERRKGLPIGNLTSQFFANVYLSPLDHFLKETLRHRYYIRYVDDFVIFDNSKERLWEVMEIIGDFLEKLRLRLHPKKCFVVPVSEGLEFLGYRVFTTHRRIRADTLRRFLRRMKRMREGNLPPENLSASLAAWLGHAMHADSFRLREKLEQQFKV